jgi:hypothetical protein
LVLHWSYLQAEAKVNQGYALIILDHNVGGLKVAMGEARSVDFVQVTADASQNRPEVVPGVGVSRCLHDLPEALAV